ncbi:MAG: radical SAM protein [Candidatus Omnitrophica bacterium]|nr:radical SAM protein [Candidatus Omnitrophota bacterium]
MKILLIKPPQGKVYGIKMLPAYPSLGILYIAAALEKQNHKVKLLDMDVDVEDQLDRLINNFGPHLIGITAGTTTINKVFSLVHEIKRIKNIPIVLGGIHPTAVPEDCILHREVDFLVIGEGECTIVKLAKTLEEERGDFSSVNGLWYKKNNRIYNNLPRLLEKELDNISFPSWHLVKHWYRFRPPDAKRLPAAPLMTSRGCPKQCTFCCSHLIFGRGYRIRSIDNILEEIDILVRDYGVKEIHFVDDAFNLIKERVLVLCQKIKERDLNINFEFSNGLLAENIDEDILSALKSIGVINVGFGVETADDIIRRSVKKGLDLETAERSFKLAKKMGFETWGFFIFGVPGETTDSIKATIEFARRVNPTFTKFMILKPYPGTEMHKYLSEKKLINDFNFDNYGVYTPPVHHLDSITSKELLYWQKRAFKEFYLRPHKIISYILRINSLARFKLTLNNLLFIILNFVNIFRRNRAVFKPNFVS